MPPPSPARVWRVLAPQVKRGHPPESVLQQLFKHTRLQQRFHGNMVALVEGAPRTLSLKEFLAFFLTFR